MKLFIYCAGGIGREIYDIATLINVSDKLWDKIFFIDDTITIGEVYGTLQCTYEQFKTTYKPTEVQVVIANGEPKFRKILIKKLRTDGYSIASIIDKTARVSPTSRLGQGVILYPNTYISSNSIIGDNTLISVGTCIGHDSVIGENVVISTQASISGSCQIGNNTYIGTKSVLKEHVTVGEDSIIGMGSCVFRDVENDVIALGNPAREIRRNESKKVFD